MNDVELENYIENCQKLLQMVAVLYDRGYNSIHPIPNIREGTGRWRLFLHSGENNVIPVHQWFEELGNRKFQNKDFAKSECSLSTETLADHFIEDNELWLQQSKLNPQLDLFIRWYRALLTSLKKGDLPYVFNMDVDSAWGIESKQFRTQKVIPCDFLTLQLPLFTKVKLLVFSLSQNFLNIIKSIAK